MLCGYFAERGRKIIKEVWAHVGQCVGEALTKTLTLVPLWKLL